MTGPPPPPPPFQGLDPTPVLGYMWEWKKWGWTWMGILTTKAEEGLRTSHFRLPTSDFRLPTSDFRLPTSVAIKDGGRPTRLLPYAKMLLVSITFFLLLGRLCHRRFYIFYWANAILAARLTLRGHGTHIDWQWFLFRVCRICPLMKKHFLLPRLKRKAFYYGWVRL